mmetsp:Transcript_16460/g.57581  ORF Transcript_16460/g.57581 Transcript_16460/m.57581 type:complete len:174 (+) Transcript_16460:1010-1531(+)
MMVGARTAVAAVDGDAIIAALEGGSSPATARKGHGDGRGHLVSATGTVTDMSASRQSMALEADMQREVGVSESDTAFHRAEALRVYLERRLGLENFLRAYKLLEDRLEPAAGGSGAAGDEGAVGVTMAAFSFDEDVTLRELVGDGGQGEQLRDLVQQLVDFDNADFGDEEFDE